MAFVIDTSGLIAYFKAEPIGGPEVRTLLEEPGELLLPFMAIMEAQYVLTRTFGGGRAEQFVNILRSLGAPIVESTPAWGSAAARIKAGGGLSMGDAWIAALALMHDATLVHRYKEFDRVAGLKTLHLGRTRAK